MVHQNLPRLKELSELIDIGLKVKQTLETDGWKLIIEPMLDKMILDVIGGKQNGRWHNGSLGDKRLGETRIQNLCWYKRALTDFHNYIHEYVDHLDKYQEEYDNLYKDTLHPEYTEPGESYVEEGVEY